MRVGRADGSLPKGWNSFHDEVGEMAARMVTMDYINSYPYQVKASGGDWEAAAPASGTNR